MADAGTLALEEVQLEPHYYRDNFLRLCDAVEKQYADLLNPEEAEFIATWRALPHAAQCLYVRLISRVGPWFRPARLTYPEIGDLRRPLLALQEAGLAVASEELEVDELGYLYTVAELRLAYAELAPEQRRGKAALLQGIADLQLDPTEHLPRLAAIGAGAEPLVAPLDTEVVDLLQLLFFGNRHQGLTDFVLSDLGVARYYPYSLERAQRLFPARAALDEYLALVQLGDLFYELCEAQAWGDIPALALRLLDMAQVEFPSSESRRDRLCNSVARELERRGAGDLALELYARSARHPSRERSARVLEAGGDWAGALAICERIGAGPRCEAELDAARRMRPRLQRRLGQRPEPRKRDQFTARSLALQQTGESVEMLAAAALAEEWSSVYYVENWLMNGLFGLAFWEQIFAPVAGAFHNPFQAVPADMYDPAFRQRREIDVQRRLEQLRHADLEAELGRAWRRFAPFQCRWVNRRILDEKLVAEAARLIPAAHLLAVWERMLFDPGENRRGFPDLLALGERPGDYAMIEVKGPGDKLQDSQARWLRFFQANEIPASVLWVAWDDD